MIHTYCHSLSLLDALPIAEFLAASAHSYFSAYFDRGVAFSTGSHGAVGDLIESHKWFHLAAVAGHDEAGACRAEVADEMSAREIAEAQRRAREWLTAANRAAGQIGRASCRDRVCQYV